MACAYEKLFRQLSSYPIVLLEREKYNYCFRDLISGLSFHDILSIDSDRLAKQRMPGSMADFQVYFRSFRVLRVKGQELRDYDYDYDSSRI